MNQEKRIRKISEELKQESEQRGLPWLLKYTKDLDELTSAGWLRKRKAIHAAYISYPHGSMIILNALKDKEDKGFYAKALEDLKTNPLRKCYLKTDILKSTLYKYHINEPLYLAEGGNILGIIKILPPEKIENEEQFEKFENKTCVYKQEAEEWWGRTKDLYSYPVVVLEVFNPPKKYNRPKEPQAFIRNLEIGGMKDERFRVD